MVQGRVKWFDSKRRFGFIEATETGADVFVNCAALARCGEQTLLEGDRVEFEMVELAQGVRAKNVRKLNLTRAPE